MAVIKTDQISLLPLATVKLTMKIIWLMSKNDYHIIL